MNVFFLHPDPVLCAQMHCDKHCVKMILETAQILSTAHHLTSLERHPLLYKPTHANHPSAVWARANRANYAWLHALLVELCREYTHRYGRVHKTQAIGLVDVLAQIPGRIPTGDFCAPPPAMPNHYKVPGDCVSSYRAYYRGDKAGFARWTNRETPTWMQ